MDILFDDIFYIEDKRSNPWSTFLKESTLKVKDPKQIELYEFVKYDLGILKPLIRKEFLTNHCILYREDIKYGEDFLFFLEILSCNAIAYLYPQPFYYYTSREGSLITEKLNAIPQILEEDIKLINSNRFEPKVIRALEERKRGLELNLFSGKDQKRIKKRENTLFYNRNH